MTTDAEVRLRVARLYDYLSALAQEVHAKPVRHVENHDIIVEPRQIPSHPRVRLGASAGETWLRVAKIAKPTPPPLSPHLASVISDLEREDPFQRPHLTLEPRHAAHGDVVSEEFERWVADVWTAWAESARSATLARALYEVLFRLRQRLRADEATHELVWGHAVLGWRYNGHRICHPLLTTRARIDFDAETGELAVVPEGLPALELDHLQGIGVPGISELTKLSEELRHEHLDVWSQDSLESLSRRLLAPLGLDSRLEYQDDLPDSAAIPVVTLSWRLFVRKRRVMFPQFFDRLKQVVAACDRLPAPIVALAAGEREVRRVLGTDAQDWAPVAERMLLPLAANDQQEQIAQKLATHSGVTVQGPPGTGKSHTIANLISHLVAHGKRVLVTAHKDQALAVLRDKIPPELRDLSLAVLGSSAADMTALERSVNAITEAADLVDERHEATAVAVAREQLDVVEAEVLQLRKRLRDALTQEREEFTLGDDRRRALEVADWLARTEAELSFIPDAITLPADCPLSPQEVNELFHLSHQIGADEASACGQHLPSPEQLPRGETMARREAELQALSASLSGYDRYVSNWATVDQLAEHELAELIEATSQAATHLATLEEPWLVQLRRQTVQGEQWGALWSKHAERLRAHAVQCARLRTASAGARVELPNGHSPREVLDLLRQARQRFQEGKKVSALLQRGLAQFLKNTFIDGETPQTVDDVDRVTAHIELHRLRDAAVRLWSDEVMAALNAPAVPDNHPIVETWMDARAQEISHAISWETITWPDLRTRLHRVIARGAVPAHATTEDLGKIAGLLHGLRARGRQRSLIADAEDLAERLAAGRSVPGASPLWAELAVALAGADWQRWDTALATATRLRALHPQAVRLIELNQRLAAVAPQWARRIRETGGSPEHCGNPGQLQELWTWRQAETWLSELLHGSDLAQIQRRLVLVQEDQRRLTLELTRRSAWLATKCNLGDAQRQALVGWLQTLRRIGKGTTERANKFRAEAQRLMPHAMGAVPVWIMPYYRVAESFDPSVAPPFDVVIIDESSQCDVFALGLLGLGHKIVVVGDDKQISPSAVGVNRARVDELVHAHLRDFPHALLLDLESSLYDASTRLFPGVVRLREHFRCLPRIIEFSSQMYYGGEIQPLREESANRLPGPAIRAVYVAEGVRQATHPGEVNVAEADAIVNQVVQCCSNPVYDGRSMGVISLLGSSKQAQYIDQHLLYKLGPEEYEKRKLRCGDAYSFQGDERDVIFISVVADDNRAAFITKAYEQRVNVAASRAKDQMWVFHSVRADQLHPDDQRAALIRYCTDQQRSRKIVEGLEERCESDFERRVLRMLLTRGYLVTPQHQVGSLRIDLVVRGGARKLAIECDGDKFHGPDQWEDDLRRQTILERLGWRFWRVRGSVFYRDPDAAMAPLWQLLDEMRIHPGDDEDNIPPAMLPDVLNAVERPVELIIKAESTPQEQALPAQDEPKPAPSEEPSALETSRVVVDEVVEAVLAEDKLALTGVDHSSGNALVHIEPKPSAPEHPADGDRPQVVYARPPRKQSSPRQDRHEPVPDEDEVPPAPSIDELFAALLVVEDRPPTAAVVANSSDAHEHVDPSSIRQWALDLGMDVGLRGRLPDYVVTAYKRAHKRGFSTPAAPERETSLRSDTDDQRSSGDEARRYVRELASALSKRGIKTFLASDPEVLHVSNPPRVVARTAGRVIASLSDGCYIWSTGRFRSTHPLNDAEGAAEAIDLASSGASRPAGGAGNRVHPPVHTGSTAGRSSSPHRPGMRPEALSYLTKLANELARLGVDAAVEPENGVVSIKGPSDVAERTTGEVKVLISSARFAWGSGLSRSTHPIDDHNGAAQEIIKGSSLSPSNESQHGHISSPASLMSTSDRPLSERSARPTGIDGKPITDYKRDDLIALIQWLKSDGRPRTHDELIDEALTELGLFTRTATRVRILGGVIRVVSAPSPHADAKSPQADQHYQEVLKWARDHRYELDGEGEIPEHVLYHYNRANPNRPYQPN